MKKHTRVRFTTLVHQVMLENCAVMECSLKDASPYIIYGLLKLKSELLDVQGLLLTLTGQSYKSSL
jgi:hypothetical protein